MITRIRTSKESKERMESLNRVLHFSSNAVLLRYALARSISNGINVLEDPESKQSDSAGFEIPRSTLFGEYEAVYKYAMGINKNDPDEKFFPTLTAAHLEKGLKLLERDYKLSGNKERFLKNLINKYC